MKGLNEHVVAVFFHGLMRNPAPPEPWVDMAVMMYAKMQFPDAYRVNEEDLKGNKMASFPRGHPFRDGARVSCAICLTTTSFPDTATFCAHLFGQKHRKSLLNQLNRCPTCRGNMGDSVQEHLFTQQHLDARYAIFVDTLGLVMSYQDELVNDAPGTHM